MAVASAEGMLVNLHLGEADQFLIINTQGQTIDRRSAPLPGGGAERWRDLAALLQDCRAVLVSGAGDSPRRIFAEAGVPMYLTEGLVSDAVEAIFRSQPVAPPRRAFRCGEVCSGQGSGCG